MKPVASTLKISDLPKFLLHRDLIRKHKLFGKEKLSSKEKETLRLREWDFIGDDDETTDLCNIFLQKKTLSFLELKNRIDSGGVSARREIYDNKFKRILTYFIDNKPLFKKGNQKYSLIDFYKTFEINKIEIALGILFSTDGKLANQESDKRFGFYSSTKDGFEGLIDFIKKNNLKISNIDRDALSILLKIENNFTIEIENVYGQNITDFLFQQTVPLDNLIKNKYDDIWLFQLLIYR